MNIGKITFGAPRTLPPARISNASVILDGINRQHTQALAKTYADGVKHGFETTLRLLLGESADGAPPFAGELSADARAWAEAALAKAGKP